VPNSLSPASRLKESKDLRGRAKVEKIRNRLLASLPTADLSLLSRHLRDISIEQGQILEERGEPVDRVYFPQTGMISLIVTMAEDSALEVGTVGYEGAIGMAAGLGSRISSIRALVQVSGTALCIPVSNFRSAANRSRRIREMTVTYGEMLLIQAQQTAACNGLHDASSRICRWLLQTSDKTDSDLIPFTQEFFGHMLGVQRTTVSEAVSKLQAAGLIDAQYGQMRIIDRTGLKGEACECYEIVRKHVDRLLEKT
jgi:CRP-like cAMP-binding protein